MEDYGEMRLQLIGTGIWKLQCNQPYLAHPSFSGRSECYGVPLLSSFNVHLFLLYLKVECCSILKGSFTVTCCYITRYLLEC